VKVTKNLIWFGVNRILMITLFQHGIDESAGEIETCLARMVIPYSTIRLFEDDPLPEELPSGLIILGGQMSINDVGDYPFFRDEKQIVRKMVAAERPVLGICLGAQMIASAFGEQVIPGPREQGWTRIHGCGENLRPAFPGTLTVFHWHNETFELPAGAELLATGKIVKNQAFRLGSAVGVQFHPEVTGLIISYWSKDLPPDSKSEMKEDTEHYCDISLQQCHSLIEQFLWGWDC
jgi:GMP synthase (glutamine-hydrolysing)